MKSLTLALKDGDHGALLDLLSEIMERQERGGSIVDEKRALERAYRHGTEEQRARIVNALLEHLFEVPGISETFEDWRSDDILGVAFAQATRWASYVTRKRNLLAAVARPIAEELMKREGVAQVRAPEIGTDTVAIEWKTSADSFLQLVVDGDSELLDQLESMSHLGPSWLAALLAQALDPQNWEPDPYDPWTRWLRLHAVLF